MFRQILQNKKREQCSLFLFCKIVSLEFGIFDLYCGLDYFSRQLFFKFDDILADCFIMCTQNLSCQYTCILRRI